MNLNRNNKPIISKYWISSSTTGNSKEWYRIMIEGHKTSYEINKYGIVRNRDTHVEKKVNVTSSGYLSTKIYYLGKHCTIGIHRLLACIFIPIPKELLREGHDQSTLMPNHKDGNKLNNSLDNLEWVTPSGNMQHALDNGLCDSYIGENSHLAIINENTAIKICELLQSGLSPNEVSERTGVKIRIVRHIYDGECWKQISKNYTFKHIERGPGSIPDNVIVEVCEMLQSNSSKDKSERITMKQIADKLNISAGYVFDIKRRRRRTDISKDYVFD